ncbi:hypothetical protein ABT288_48045 [Streptomyces sp. NPDC001093]|uniref:hypothetical protein n=1 Tax=Streptomyces sp. NPDC001093 TaxID=3154376 RepID=UPI003329ECAB
MDDQQLGPDGEAALQHGRELLAAGDRDGAEERFAEAAELGALDAPWRIAQAYLEAHDTRTAAWMRRAATSLSQPGGITVDPDTLPITTIRCEDYEVLADQVWCVAVTDCDPQAAVAALRAAAPSIGQATEDGRVPAADQIATAPYYANCTWVDETKLTLTLDAKDGVMPMLARVVLTVLVAELERTGATQARLHTPRSAWPLY